MPHQHSYPIEMGPGHLSRSRQRASYQFQLHRDAQHLLRQIVVNFTSDTVSFLQYRGELQLYPLKTKSIKLPGQDRKQQRAQNIEPIRLVEVRPQIKIEGRARRTPEAIIVRSDYPELVTSGPQVCVVRNATRSTIYPVAVKPFELVFEPDFFRSNKTKRRVIKIKTALARRELNRLSRSNRVIIDADLLNSNRRWLIV